MINKTLLGIAAAGAIVAGSLGATTTSASAASIHVGNNGVYVGFGGHGPHGKKVCKPIYKKVGWKDKWGNWHTRWKVVDYKCSWRGHGGWHGGWNGGWNGGHW
jgi:hypothetical protein